MNITNLEMLKSMVGRSENMSRPMSYAKDGLYYDFVTDGHCILVILQESAPYYADSPDKLGVAKLINSFEEESRVVTDRKSLLKWAASFPKCKIPACTEETCDSSHARFNAAAFFNVKVQPKLIHKFLSPLGIKENNLEISFSKCGRMIKIRPRNDANTDYTNTWMFIGMVVKQDKDTEASEGYPGGAFKREPEVVLAERAKCKICEKPLISVHAECEKTIYVNMAAKEVVRFIHDGGSKQKKSAEGRAPWDWDPEDAQEHYSSF